ncbi:MAG: LytR C-terminal domain-containing protein [Actinomycetes bacterium]|nr:LytR C-terminal domain-containing protein [Actinomycetes bacterium]MDX5380670.1 LytR C-terminal domain-containing protein [Actinomycetes bacterium]MDX5399633.1 LytR C-terminal domain-containing protein [Actinomycetes bacterium]MDX5450415.1 LytR C-terminal domain-containing protein [Actinomycetes bacterium]
MSRYPEDEFDIAARNRGPKGVHRQAESTFRRLLPFLVVIVAAPLLAWGVLSLLNEDGDGGAPVASPAASPTTPSPTDGSTGEPTTTPTATATASAEPTPSPEPSPTPTESAVQFDAPVAVLNGAGVAGIAGRTADRLTAAGFTAVTPGNYASAQPTATTIFYNNAELAETAQAIGAELGIDLLVELASATDSVVVVLRGDFQE